MKDNVRRAIEEKGAEDMTRMAGSGSKQKRWMFLGLTLFTVVCFGQAMAQGGVVLDGVGDDWDAAWQVATDGLDVFITDTGEHPHAPPTYARSGYDALALWAHYQAADDRWYFRIDVDGRGGDSDSQVGTASNLGVGTDGYDGGPLVVAPFQDRAGLGNSEAYKLGFQYQSGGLGLVAELGPGTTILPGVLSDLGGDVSGQGIYSTTVPGVVEFGLDREELFPDGSFHNQLWVSGQIGDNNDRVSDDQINAVWVVGLNLAAYCPEAPVLSGEEATFPLRYAIPAGAAQGVTDAKLTALVPADTTFVSASDGGTESGGVITWDLGDLAPGDTGQVFFTLHIETSLTTIVIESEMSCAEGLRHQAANQCSVQQPTPTNTPTPTLTGTPTNTPTPSQTPTPSPTRPTNTPTATATATATATPTTTPTPRITGTPKPSPGPSDTPIVPEPATVSLVLTGMAGLAGYVLIQARGRRK